ncbi:TonB-dependent receptor [Rhodanobacter sp. 115]|uniref:TonB-dependent receptor n=1 Tax=Rhodanobacter sp. FW021-MT20 TaxID=1162282 RepID=UPI000260DB54|nr:TonB-dependent receptor [Rhodanobacter sp. 115]EIL91236.1 TonB-dependent outer membrane receptor [Rhodanobacter sp. 115]
MALAYLPGALHAQDANQGAGAAQEAGTPAKPAVKAGKPGEQKDVKDLTAVTVTGIRASLESAESLKQNASQIIDSVTATDINALPDRSVTETLQRISGVTVDHFLADNDPDHPSAEGSGVLIRGLPYVASELNGRDSFSANNGRALGFEDVPAELMEGVDVYKNPSAEIIEGGIGGTVNLRTRMPFDTGKATAFSYGINEGDMSKKSKPSASFLYSNTWKTENLGDFGVLFDVSYSELASRNDGIQTNPYVLRPDTTDSSYYAPDIAAGAPNGEGFVPGDINWQQMDMQRRRIGLYGAFQWRPTKDLELYSQFFRSNYNLHWNEHWVQTNENNYNAVMPEDGTAFTYDGGGVFQNGWMASNAWHGSPSAGPAGNVEYYTDNRMQTQFTRTTDWSNGFKYNISDNMLLTGDLQFVRSISDTLDFSVYDQFYMPPADVNLSGSVPSLTPSDPGYLANPANYYLGAAMDHIEHDYGMERAARLDLEYDFDSDWLRNLRIGVRATDRDAYSNNTNSSYNWGAISQPWMGDYTGPSSLDWLDKVPSWMSEQFTMPDFYRGANLPTTLWFPSNALVGNYAKAIQALYAEEMSGGWCAQGTTDGSCTPGAGMSQNHMNEKTQAAYVSLYFGSPDDRFEGNVGVRLVRTSVSSNGSVTFPSTIAGDASTLTPEQLAMFSGAVEPINGSSDYRNALPSLNLRYKITDDLQWRFAASKAMSRPDISQLNSYLTIGASWGGAAGQESHITGWTGATGGNPDLKPMEANQFDTALEWYFAPAGELYTTVFYKKIKNYITNEISTQVINGQDIAVTGPVNAGDGRVKGFEVGYSQFFSFLPGAWSGLGVQANYTFLQSSKIAGTTSCDPDHNNGSCSSDMIVTNPPLPMAGLSPHSYNLTAMYEHSKWSGRLAWSWRGRYLITSEDSGDTYLPMWNASSGQLDGSVFYRVDKDWQVGLLLNNITDTTTRVLMGPTTYTGNSATNPTTAPAGYVDHNLYTRAIFLNDRRYELVVRAKF